MKNSRAKAETTRKERKLLCFLDQTDKAEIGGWAVDFDAAAESLKMRVLIDGAIEEVVNCDLHRDDSRLVNLANSRIGFKYRIPERYWDGVRHALRFMTLDGMALPISSRAGGAVEEYSFVLEKPVRLMAVVDGMVDGLIQGWALRVDDKAGTKLGGVRVLVTHDGQPVAELLADQFRGDVAEAVGADAACGFAFAPPPELRRRDRVNLRFFALPEREELGGSPLEISFPGDSAREKIEALIKRTDELFSFAYHLKKELKAAIPRERFLLADYPRWALEARPLALPRAKARYGAKDVASAKVSVICPVYRPGVGDFLAAVDSVRAQTHENWELLLIDDAGGDATLTAVMRDLAAQEARIKLLQRKKNGGIAQATNDGLKAAKGDFIAFFDHDDLLEPGALEIMLLAQAATGAKLLYEDGTVQHAGVVLGVGGVADHAFRGLGAEAPGYMAHAITAQEVSAVTAACMLVRRSAFDAVGGFDERDLSVAFNDVDLCVKLRSAGMKIIYMPDTMAEHRESVSRGDDFDHAKLARFMLENEVMRQRHEAVLPNDPYYNRNFSREGGVYRELRLLQPGEE